MKHILTQKDGLPYEIVNKDGSAGICLLCEHASASIPDRLGDLGLSKEDRFSHAVWDIGADALARALSAKLDAPLIVARTSRLVYDLNRPPHAPDVMPSQSGEIRVPGNRDISEAEKAARTADIYEPFHTAVSTLLDAFEASPVLVTIHTFTPVWQGKERTTELGLLHDIDARLALAMMKVSDTECVTRLNEPYSAKDGVTHSLQRHAIPRGLLNVMIEVRNDLLEDEAQILRMSDLLAEMVSRACETEVSTA